MIQEIFRMERVTYKEHEITLLEDFNVEINRGEIVGLSSVNGHGLGVLLRLMETNLPLHDGYIYYCGELINSWKGAAKPNNRISVIGSENRLVESLNVIDNIFVLRNGFRQEIIHNRMLEKQLLPFLEDIGINIPLDISIERLSVFERLVLEIVRAIVQGHYLIVLNDIGTLLSYEELEKMHRILRHYAGQGFSFLYICPHYEELASICGRTLLLSNGRILKVLQRDRMADEIIRYYSSEYEKMVRTHMENRVAQLSDKKTVFRLKNIQGEYLKGLTLDVRKGECLVIRLQHNDIFVEAREVLMGNRSVEFDELEIDGKRRKKILPQQAAVISEVATETMIFPELTYMENLCMSMSMRVPSIWRSRKIQKSIRQEYGPILGEEVFDMKVENLSERQKQQLIYTRILLARPKIVFCIQPFKGADLPHRMLIWEQLEMLMNHGIAVVIISLTISDSLSLADRIIMLGKEESKEFIREDFDKIPENVPWMFLYKKKERIF